MREDSDGTTDIIRQHWDRRANSFDDELGHGLVSDEQRRAWLDLLSRLVGSSPRRVLDVGCGTGFLALRLAELGHTVTGIDLAPQMIEQARRKAEQQGQQIDFRVGDASAIDLPDETCDFVLARHVIWNLPDPEQAVAEWRRVLRPGGRLLLVEGKWAENDAAALGSSRPAVPWLTRLIEAGAALVLPKRSSYARRLVYRRYRRIEARLPFSGGPTPERLAAFLEANDLHDVEVVPVMDPTLWGGTPEFARYLVAGTRSLVAQPR
jgi:ubiquinone/menaquinone biosynthesis C-methylase UbiE